ncbi:MAG TPA: transglutaminase domain-containing protein, partial [bacterium]|nr:transglutaminase domain-containing protein [bacterium]
WFAPYGWVPADVTYGRRDAEDPVQHWFYLSGMDSYRLIFNDDVSRPFDPPKEHFRSETLDSQRGELEWRGGNLYFDQWDWELKWEVLP